MIDFRYHIVSIVAIFLALAVGIVLGSGPLKDDISGFLEARTNELAREKLALQDDIASLRGEQDSSEEYASLVQQRVVSGQLIGQPVVVILLPNASKDAAAAVATAIEEAGGRVTERVEIRKEWLSADNEEILGELAQTLVRRGGANDPYELAGQAVAGAVVTDNERLIGQAFAPSDGILAAFKEAGFIRIPDGPSIRAGSAVVVGSGDTSEAQSATLLPLIGALEAEGQGEVVSGPITSSESGGIVSAVRDSELADLVSTVDNADTAQGVTVSVLALVDERKGLVGHYGVGPNVDGPAPDPVPGS